MKRYLLCFLVAGFFPGFAAAQWRADIVSRLPDFATGGAPAKVRFCPKDAQHVLASVGNKESVIETASGKVRVYSGKGSIVDWVDHHLLVKDGDKYLLVDDETLRPLAARDGDIHEMARAAADQLAQARPQLVGRGKDAQVVREFDGDVLYKGPFFGGIYGFDTNQSLSLWLVFLGNADYLVYNPQTKKKIKLPGTPTKDDPNGFSAWRFGGERYLIGEQGVAPAGASAEVDEESLPMSTRLFYFDLESQTLEPITLPESLLGKALEVLDASNDGHLFLAARSLGNGHLGAWILKLRR